jgi:hypothetical protein
MLVSSLAFATGLVAAPLNLYEWLATAPVIVAGENVGMFGKHAEFRVESVLRGNASAGAVIRVAVRRANRDRNRHVDKALKFEKDLSYLLLLAPSAKQKADGPPMFELVRGARGAREVPPEGREAYLDAVVRFVRIHERNDDLSTWRELTGMLEETNPLLIETALEQFLKFGRGSSGLLGTLRPLLVHPSHTMRERAARLIGQILQRAGAEPIPDLVLVQAELAAKARRDSSVPVRVAATEALDAISAETVDTILAEIAREDPDQTVRYAAERLIYDRQRRRGDGEAEDPGDFAAREGSN